MWMLDVKMSDFDVAREGRLLVSVRNSSLSSYLALGEIAQLCFLERRGGAMRASCNK
jgi:hypothetical protein